jgi:hypothetical protein
VSLCILLKVTVWWQRRGVYNLWVVSISLGLVILHFSAKFLNFLKGPFQKNDFERQKNSSCTLLVESRTRFAENLIPGGSVYKSYQYWEVTPLYRRCGKSARLPSNYKTPPFLFSYCQRQNKGHCTLANCEGVEFRSLDRLIYNCKLRNNLIQVSALAISGSQHKFEAEIEIVSAIEPISI